MRERWARNIAYLTGLLVLLLAAAFAWYLNSPFVDHAADVAPPAAPTSADSGRDQVERGRVLFSQLGCGSCHALPGQGSAAGSLDAAVSVLDDADIREWIIAGPSVENQLSRRTLERKKKYRELSPGDLDALVEYLKRPEQSAQSP